MSAPIIQEKQTRTIIHTLPYLRNQWIVRIDNDLQFLKSFQNKCEAIYYGRELAIVNQAEHWIHHNNGEIMSKENYSQCREIFEKVEHTIE